MQEYFFELAEFLCGKLQGEEVLLLSLNAETSDFTRLNNKRIRQAGHVRQARVTLELVDGARHASLMRDIQCESENDHAGLLAELRRLRALLAHLPDDPYLNFSREIQNSEHIHQNTLPDAGQAVDAILGHGGELDLTGIWASGTVYRGFANSLGQRNWHSSASFNFDFSCYAHDDKAVKSAYAGFDWDETRLVAKLAAAREQLDVMRRPAKTLRPGAYRAYLAPSAIAELLGLLSWISFDIKSQRTAQSPLYKMIAEDRRLQERVSLFENTARGLAPRFSPQGYMADDKVMLIEQGKHAGCLADGRGAREYDVPVNATEGEPNALEMSAGELDGDLLAELDNGIYINNLWYCNFSDPLNCRITGMTRFACFWVENGEIQAPINVMRFDDSLFSMFGDKLAGLTRERELILDPDTYEQRSLRSYLLPGALLDEIKLTL